MSEDYEALCEAMKAEIEWQLQEWRIEREQEMRGEQA